MQQPSKKRFRLVKLEERVVPSHLPAVAQVVVASPAIEHAPTHAHKVDFAANSDFCVRTLQDCFNTLNCSGACQSAICNSAVCATITC